MRGGMVETPVGRLSILFGWIVGITSGGTAGAVLFGKTSRYPLFVIIINWIGIAWLLLTLVVIGVTIKKTISPGIQSGPAWVGDALKPKSKDP